MNRNLSDHGELQVHRLAMHVGLMAYLVQTGASLNLVQSQATMFRTVLSEILALDEAPDASVQMPQLLSSDIADALAEDWEVPDTPGELI